MTRTQLIGWALQHGYAPDPYGHYQKELGNGFKRRLKLSTHHVSYERRVLAYAGTYHTIPAKWVRIKSGYISKLSISPEGKLQWTN
jgi:hypothetical protein